MKPLKRGWGIILAAAFVLSLFSLRALAVPPSMGSFVLVDTGPGTALNPTIVTPKLWAGGTGGTGTATPGQLGECQGMILSVADASASPGFYPKMSSYPEYTYYIHVDNQAQISAVGNYTVVLSNASLAAAPPAGSAQLYAVTYSRISSNGPRTAIDTAVKLIPATSATNAQQILLSGLSLAAGEIARVEFCPVVDTVDGWRVFLSPSTSHAIPYYAYGLGFDYRGALTGDPVLQSPQLYFDCVEGAYYSAAGEDHAIRAVVADNTGELSTEVAQNPPPGSWYGQTPAMETPVRTTGFFNGWNPYFAKAPAAILPGDSPVYTVAMTAVPTNGATCIWRWYLAVPATNAADAAALAQAVVADPTTGAAPTNYLVRAEWTLPMDVVTGYKVSATTCSVVSVSVADAWATEPGTDTGTFTVTRQYNTNQTLTVYYTMSGTAASGVDYVALPGAVTIAAGKTSTNIVLTPIENSINNGPRTAVLTILPDPTYRVGVASNGTVNVLDDKTPIIKVASTVNAVEPAAPGTFTITRSGTGTGTSTPVTVYYTVSGTATGGVDYAALSGSASLTGNQTTATISVTPIGSVFLGSRTVIVTLTTNAAYEAYGPSSSATMTLYGQYTLTTATAGAGSGTVILTPPGGSYAYGTVVTLTATPNTGSLFSVWSGSLSGSVNPTTLTLNGNKSVTATFTQSPPAITTQPTNATVTAGQTATFTVAATGTAPLTYQWKMSGVAISLATNSSYTTSATTTNDNGKWFSVIVSNLAGYVTSSNALLTVHRIPSFQTLEHEAGGGRGMDFMTDAGVPYEVDWKTNLITDTWHFYTNFIGTGSSAHVCFTNAVPQSFFEIKATL